MSNEQINLTFTAKIFLIDVNSFNVNLKLIFFTFEI